MLLSLYFSLYINTRLNASQTTYAIDANKTGHMTRIQNNAKNDSQSNTHDNTGERRNGMSNMLLFATGISNIGKMSML